MSESPSRRIAEALTAVVIIGSSRVVGPMANDPSGRRFQPGRSVGGDAHAGDDAAGAIGEAFPRDEAGRRETQLCIELANTELCHAALAHRQRGYAPGTTRRKGMAVGW